MEKSTLYPVVIKNVPIMNDGFTDDHTRYNIDAIGVKNISSTVPVRKNFTGDKIGEAFIFRNGGVLMAHLSISKEVADEMKDGVFPAVGLADTFRTGYAHKIKQLKSALLTEVSLCSNNADPDIPPINFGK